MPAFFLRHLLIHSFELVKALVHHQPVRQKERLERVIGVDEVLNHKVAPLDLLSGQMVLDFDLVALNQSQLSLEVGNFLLHALDDDTRVNSLISDDFVLDQ